MAKQHFREQGTRPEVRNEFRIALNSIPYRFKTFAESGVSFADSIQSHGDAPPQPHRYLQERVFFSFVIAGVAAFEALHYSLFAWGSALRPDAFPLLSEKNRRSVSPEFTATRFGDFPAAEPLARTLRGLQESGQFRALRKWRIVLFHRGLPGRHFSVSVGGRASGEPVGRYKEFGDLKGPDLNPGMPQRYRDWLSGAIEDVFATAMEAMPGLAEGGSRPPAV